jgi:hypothetical protein
MFSKYLPKREKEGEDATEHMGIFCASAYSYSNYIRRSPKIATTFPPGRKYFNEFSKLRSENSLKIGATFPCCYFGLKINYLHMRSVGRFCLFQAHSCTDRSETAVPAY